MPVEEQVAVNEEIIKQEALTVIERAQIVAIVDQESYDSACSLLLDQIKPFRAKWAAYWDSIKKPAYAAYKAIQDKFNEGDKPLEVAEKKVKAALAQWTEEQERKRLELQRQAEEELRKREQQEREQSAAVAEDMGATDDEVEAIMSAPSNEVAAPVAPTYEKVSGVSVKEQWSARVTDVKKLALAVAKGQVPISYIEPNMVALNARARADRATMNVPGVVAVKNSVVAGRAK